MERYTDPVTGFEIATNADSWQVGWKPPAPEPVEEAAPTWGDVGQGVRGKGNSIPTLDELSDHRVWTENKENILNYYKDHPGH